MENSEGYDNKVVEESIRKIGCKPPYKKSEKDWPICSSMEDMQMHSSHNAATMKVGKYHMSPCKLMSVIDCDIKKIVQADTGQHFRLRVGFPDYFRSIKLIKAIDIQSLIGNTGGYVGLVLGKKILLPPIHHHTDNIFSIALNTLAPKTSIYLCIVGCAIMQLPEFILYIYSWLKDIAKRSYGALNHRETANPPSMENGDTTALPENNIHRVI